MARQVAAGGEATRAGTTTLREWFLNVDRLTQEEAQHCLVAGAYSRGLLASLRAAFPPSPWPRRGLDDPHRAQPGDPLGANVQTFLREQFLRPLNPPHGEDLD